MDGISKSRQYRRCLQLLILAVTLQGAYISAGAGSNQARPVSWAFNSTIPLGTDLLVLQPSKLSVAFMVSAESEEFKSWKLIEQSDKRKIVGSDGQPIKKMPARVTFRVTAGTKDRLTDTPGYPISTQTKLNEFLLNLRFRVKVFRGIDARILQPQEVKMIGIPADEPYNERIYRVAFDLGDVNIEDRVVLEIFEGNNDQRISKFHLEF